MNETSNLLVSTHYSSRVYWSNQRENHALNLFKARRISVLLGSKSLLKKGNTVNCNGVSVRENEREGGRNVSGSNIPSGCSFLLLEAASFSIR